MSLSIIGIGLSTEEDISIKGLKCIRQADKVYLDNYTSLLQCSVEDLEKLYGQKIMLADRVRVEQQDEKIVEEARSKNVVFLVIGDPFSATTHSELFKLAKQKGVAVNIIHNASVLTAVGETGLQLYKFGLTTSIPFLEDFPQLETPYNILRENKLLGMHTLMLLDIKAEQKRFMTINQALVILEEIERRKQQGLIKKSTRVIGCARLGSADFMIKSGSLEKIKKMDFGKSPHCLIVPGKLHFAEEAMLALWK